MSWTNVCNLRMDSYETNKVVDSSDFQNNADILGNIRTNPNYVSFQGTDAQLEVVVRDDSLTRFAALRIQAIVRPRAITHRLNIVEGWMSFALVIQPDGRLMGTIYDGHNWVGLDSSSISVPVGTWSRISFEYDGISIAKLTLNGSTVGSRFDMPAGISQPQRVIAIGHWPGGDGRYTFEGELGHITIERRDYEDIWRDTIQAAFCRRQFTAVQADALREIQYLTRTLDPLELDQLRQCAKARSDRIMKFLHKLRGQNPRQTANLRKLGERLRAAWCCSFNGPEIRLALLEYFRKLDGSGSENQQQFRALIDEFLDISTMCVRSGYPYDRMRELSVVLLPELQSFELKLGQIVDAV